MNLERIAGQEQPITLEQVEQMVRNRYDYAKYNYDNRMGIYTVVAAPDGKSLIGDPYKEAEDAWEQVSKTVNPDGSVNWGAVRSGYEADLQSLEAERRVQQEIIDLRAEDFAFQRLQPMAIRAERRSIELQAQIQGSAVSQEVISDSMIFGFAARELKHQLHQTRTMTAISTNNSLLRQIPRYKQILSVIPTPPNAPAPTGK